MLDPACPALRRWARIRQQFTKEGSSGMASLSPLRRLLKLVHPEGIPMVGTVFYNAISGTSVFQRTYEVLARDIADRCSEGSLLDIGTGPAWLLVKLHELAPGLQLTGLDASGAMVAKARGNLENAGLADLIELKEGNARRLPFPDGSFDGVVSTASIHHWKDPTAALMEVHRVLRPGGLALLYDLVSDTPAPILKDIAREFGRAKMLLLWVHAFEEPFYSRYGLEELTRPTPFGVGQTRFVSVMCCLSVQKQL
jgi:ubiquinone/menaquinone biosynthesis C-methylase UbiE